MAKKVRKHPIAEAKEQLVQLLEETRAADLSAHARRKIDRELTEMIAEIAAARRDLDHIKQPLSVFDPSDPRVVGRFIALSLVAQPSVSMTSLQRFYGSGIYAIYYRGDFEPYGPLKDTETPIYVGQAAPQHPGARTPTEQGEKLSARLGEHAKNIGKAQNLSLADFVCRTLVVQSGYETAAEDYLIHLFEPIWNKETKVVYGIGKHGDAAETRSNKRSPWDTLHEARKWAVDEKLADARSHAQILEDLRAHFARVKVYASLNDVFDTFIAELKQQ